MEALRQIVAKFKADLTPLDEGLDRSEKKIGGFERTLKTLGSQIAAAFAVKSIYDFTFGLIHAADATVKQAEALGLGVTEWQEWLHAADLSGVQAELLSMAFGKLNLQLNEAATKGTGPAAEALKALGLEAKTAEGKLKSSGQIIEEVADAIQGMDAVERNAQLMKLFGEQGTKLVPMLKGGSAGIKAMRAEVEALGFAFDEDFARSAEQFDDNIDRMHKGFKGLVIQGLGPLLPDLIALTGQMVAGAKATIPYVRGFVRFVRETKILQGVLAMLSLKGIGVVAKALGGWVTKMGGLSGLLTRVIPLVWKFLAPLFILEDLLTFMSGGKSLFGEKLDEWFGPGTAKGVQRVFDQIQNGQDEIRDDFRLLRQSLEKDFGAIGAFGGGVATGLMEAFLFAVDIITGKWDRAGAKIQFVFSHLWGVLDYSFTSIKFAALGVAATIQDAFVGAWNSVIESAQKAVGIIAETLAKVPGMGDTANDLGGVVKRLNGFKGGENASAEVEAARQKQMDILAAVANQITVDYQKSQSPNAASAPPSVSNSNSTQNISNHVENRSTVNVNVPPGTPAKNARDVAAAAQRGTVQGYEINNRATLESLVPQPSYFTP